MEPNNQNQNNIANTSEDQNFNQQPQPYNSQNDSSVDSFAASYNNSFQQPNPTSIAGDLSNQQTYNQSAPQSYIEPIPAYSPTPTRTVRSKNTQQSGGFLAALINFVIAITVFFVGIGLGFILYEQTSEDSSSEETSNTSQEKEETDNV